MHPKKKQKKREGKAASNFHFQAPRHSHVKKKKENPLTLSPLVHKIAVCGVFTWTNRVLTLASLYLSVCTPFSWLCLIARPSTTSTN